MEAYTYTYIVRNNMYGCILLQVRYMSKFGVEVSLFLKKVTTVLLESQVVLYQEWDSMIQVSTILKLISTPLK